MIIVTLGANGNSLSRANEFAVQFGDNQTDGFCSTGRVRNNVLCASINVNFYGDFEFLRKFDFIFILIANFVHFLSTSIISHNSKMCTTYKRFF